MAGWQIIGRQAKEGTESGTCDPRPILPPHRLRHTNTPNRGLDSAACVRACVCVCTNSIWPAVLASVKHIAVSRSLPPDSTFKCHPRIIRLPQSSSSGAVVSRLTTENLDIEQLDPLIPVVSASCSSLPLSQSSARLWIACLPLRLFGRLRSRCRSNQSLDFSCFTHVRG